jgi:hypothetical protein
MRFRRFRPENAGTPPGSENRTTRLVEQLVSDEREKSPMSEEKGLNNQHGVDGIQPSSKSRSRREPAAGASSRRSRITHAYARALEWKRPNALKHGAFSDNPAVNAENSQEFEDLHSDLIDEWQPSGPTEEEAVHSLAHDLWRKRRAQRFLQATLFVNTHDPSHPGFDEPFSLMAFCGIMSSEPETAFAKEASRFLRADKINYLTQKFPRSNYKSTSEWAEAVANEIKTVLLPRYLVSEAENEVEAGLCGQANRMRRTALLAASSELFEQELALHERLDAKIARKVKYLAETKAMKQMLRQTGALERADEQPRKIAAAKSTRSPKPVYPVSRQRLRSR